MRTIFLSKNPDEICDRLKLLLQEKQAGNNSKINNEENVAINDTFLEYNCNTSYQHKKFSSKFNLLHTKKEEKYLHLLKC